MLKYFFEHQDIPEVREVTLLINQVKKKVANNNFSLPYDEVSIVMPLLEKIKQKAIDINDEKLANSQYIVNKYLGLFSKLAEYFLSLSEKKYSYSWNILQDCLDNCIVIKRFTDVENRYEISKLVDLLEGYEVLYPYNLFCSSENLIIRSECSICGKSMQSLACNHIPDNLYWGEMAYKKILEFKIFRGISLVTHPADKRCIIMPHNEAQSEIEVFQTLDAFLEQKLPYLQQYNIIERKIVRKKCENIKIVGRNDPCSCGSGKKFKKCCLPKLYYDSYENILELGEIIELLEIT